MNPINRISIVLFLLLLSCKEDKPASEYLGVVNIEVTGDQKAIPHFEKGLLLLHSFEYADAREAFQKAQQEDPSMPMAYWGEAMTHNHSLWSEQDFDKAQEVLDRLKKVDQSGVTELEKDFLSALQTLYNSDTIKNNRDLNYAEHMGSLNKKYPDNHEIGAFYALSLLGSVADGRDETIYGKGAVIAKGILKENPNHPGALHYLIHSYDDPGHANLALEAADSYSVVAPDASHALHMPSHIYVALGMWDKVVSSNENSYQASLNRMERKGLDNNARGYHAYHWLEYGYLQQGRKEEAKNMVEDMVGFVSESPSLYGRSHLVYLKGTYLVETEEWQDDLADIQVDISDLNLTVRSQYRFLEGMKAYTRKDQEALKGVITEMEKDHQKESYLVTYEKAPFCSGATRYQTTPSMLTETQVMTEQLKALESTLMNDLAKAEAHLKRSVELEENLSYSYGPPVIQKPTHELYADWLRQQGRTEEAKEQYSKTLVRAPKRKIATSRMQQAPEA